MINITSLMTRYKLIIKMRVNILIFDSLLFRGIFVNICFTELPICRNNSKILTSLRGTRVFQLFRNEDMQNKRGQERERERIYMFVWRNKMIRNRMCVCQRETEKIANSGGFVDLLVKDR